ncbi:MAG: hypothetical protein ACM3SY_01940 [Candidatus Omnitrophota bacterium]
MIAMGKVYAEGSAINKPGFYPLVKGPVVTPIVEAQVPLQPMARSCNITWASTGIGKTKIEL